MGKFTDVLKKAIFEDTKDDEVAKEPRIAEEPKVELPKTDDIISSDGEIDEGILDKLEEKLRQEDLPGPDYLELKEAAMDKESVATEPDEKKRYRQAFNNMKRFFPKAGVTKARILESIDHYERIMVAEGEDAKDDLNRKIQEQVTSLREKIATEKVELDRQQEILRKKSLELEQREAAINEREQSLKQKSKNFIKTLEHLIGVFKSDRKKLEEYLND